MAIPICGLRCNGFATGVPGRMLRKCDRVSDDCLHGCSEPTSSAGLRMTATERGSGFHPRAPVIKSFMCLAPAKNAPVRDADDTSAGMAMGIESNYGGAEPIA